MGHIGNVLLIVLFLFPQFKYYKGGKPTTRGVEKYIEINQYDFADEFMAFVQDTLWDYFVSADDLTDYVDFTPHQLGLTFIPSEAIVHTHAPWIDYAVDSLSRFKRKITTSNAFVKGTVMHELTHIWINQILREMDYRDIYIAPEYRNFRLFASRQSIYGASFVEEGICEYVADAMDEILVGSAIKPYEGTELDDSYEIKYRYAQYYVTDFLHQSPSLKAGIIMLFSHTPPTKVEILHPENYWKKIPENIPIL